MRFYTGQHDFYCGIDLHARTMYACVLDGSGAIVAHKNLRSTPEALLDFLEPFRSDVVVAAECIFTWYWLADLCEDEGIPFVLGHALYMKIIHGGKAKNDRIDAHKIATLLRGGMLPQAYVYPRTMRATRDLLRRRLYLTRLRGLLLAHIQNTNHQYNLPAIPVKLNYPSNRTGFLDRFDDPDVHKSMEVDLNAVAHLESSIRDLELHITRQAKLHDSDTFHRLRSIPGIGKILALTVLYEVQDISRFDTVQKFASSSRLVRCPKESGGKRKALSILAHKIGRVAYDVMNRRRNFDMDTFLNAA